MSILLFLFFFTVFSIIYVELFLSEQLMVEELYVDQAVERYEKVSSVSVPLAMQQEIMTYADPIEEGFISNDLSAKDFGVDNSPEYDSSELIKYTVRQLKEFATEQGIKFPTKIRKADLIDLIVEG